MTQVSNKPNRSRSFLKKQLRSLIKGDGPPGIRFKAIELLAQLDGFLKEDKRKKDPEAPLMENRPPDERALALLENLQ